MMSSSISSPREEHNNNKNLVLRSSGQPENPISTLSNKWQITILKTLTGLDAFKKYVIGEKVELPSSDYEMVRWDQFKIHSIDQKKLYSTEFGPCLGLAARGYDDEGQLSHMGIAHKFIDEGLPKKFFEKMRQVVKGRIELFLAGGSVAEFDLVEKIISEAEKANIKVVDDVSMRFFKRIGLFYKNIIYRGHSRIAQLNFDKIYNPQIVVQLDVFGISNLEEVVSDPSCKFLRLDQTEWCF